MWQEEICHPPCCHMAPQMLEYRIENRIKEEGKGADHYHDFKGHDEEDDNSTLCR
jgi:hypothetical protein